MLSPIVKEQIEKKLGRSIRYHSDLEYLCFEIEKSTKNKISLNTLKRLFGFISGVNEPRLFTLDTIALYLGYSDWDIYISSLQKTGNSDFNSLQEIKIETLPVQSIIEFRYDPKRLLKIRYDGNFIFRVLHSENSKLLVDDILEIRHFALYYPLIILSVIRNGVNLGRFTAGKVGGLTVLRLI